MSVDAVEGLDIVVETGIPVVRPGNQREGIADAIKALEVGSSFALPVERRSTLAGAARYAGLRFPGRQYVVRTVDDGARVRVWRTA